MANVYESVQKFYKKKIPPDRAVIKSGQVEKYFRRQAWSGLSDEELQKQWLVLQEVVLLFANLDVALVEQPDKVEILEILYRAYIDRKHRIGVDELTYALNTLYGFLLSLPGNDKTFVSNLLVQTEHCFLEHGFFALPIRPPAESFLSLEDYDEHNLDEFNNVLDTLMADMQDFFSKSEYNEELLRAVMLFLRNHADLKYLSSLSEDVWFSFWDYFLFDYHLQRKDIQPIVLYYGKNKDRLSELERILMSDLMRMRFRVFYIVSGDEEGVLCRDLFTEEEFDMPWPDTPIGNYRQILFLGHLETKGLMMLNYIASFTVSPKLRQRIKSEVLRLYELYRLQWDEATIEDFFIRHAVSVRHIIQILTGYARLNVVTDVALPARKVSYENLGEKFQRNQDDLMQISLACGNSFFASLLLTDLYRDFYAVSKLSDDDKLSMDMLWAMVCACMCVNFGEAFVMADQMKKWGADMKRVKKFYAQIEQTLDLRKFDPRYAAEEGYVLSLVNPVG